MKEIYDFIKMSETYFIATTDKKGLAHVRPFHTIAVYNDKLYIQTDMKKNVAKQVKYNANVEFCALYGDEWLRVSGTLQKDDSKGAREHMFKEYPDLKLKYGKDYSTLGILCFSNIKAEIYNMDKKVRNISVN